MRLGMGRGGVRFPLCLPWGPWGYPYDGGEVPRRRWRMLPAYAAFSLELQEEILCPYVDAPNRTICFIWIRVLISTNAREERALGNTFCSWSSRKWLPMGL